MIANNSTQLPAARVTQVVQDAYLWAGTLFFWPPLYRARIFSSKPNTQSLNYDYYDYPVDMLTNSVSRLYIGGDKYDKKAFEDFLDYVDNSIRGTFPPDPTKKYFAEFSRQFFVYPTVATAGISDGLVWGNIQPPQLGSPTDTTIFSLWDDSGNEAICRKALSVIFARLDSSFASQQEAQAIQLLTLIWKKIALEKQRAQRLDHPRFSVPNLFDNGTISSAVGNFNSISTIF